MAKRRIEIIVTAAARGLQSGLRGAMGMVNDFVNGIKSIGSVAGAAFSALNQAVFFFTNNIRTAIQFVNGLYDTFLSQAVQAERLEVVMRNVTGSEEEAAAMMEHLSDASQQLGIDFEQVAFGGQQMAVAARDAQGEFDLDLWKELVEITMNFAALRPDVPFQWLARGVTAAMAGDMTTLTRLLDVNVNQLLGLEDEADRVGSKMQRIGGQLTGLVEVQAEETAQGGIELLRQLQDELHISGLAVDVAEETIAGAWGRIKAEFEAATREIGEKFLPLITEGLQSILDWWEEHEDEVMAIAGDMADNFIDWIKGIDWQDFADDIINVVNALSDLVDEINEVMNSPAAQWLENVFNPETGTVGSTQSRQDRLLEQGAENREGIAGALGSTETPLAQAWMTEGIPGLFRTQAWQEQQQTAGARREARGTTNVTGEWADKTIREVVELIQLNLLDQLLAGGE